VEAERRTTVYAREGTLIVGTASKTTDGVFLESGPFFTVPEDAPNEEVGATLRRALEASRSGIPHPSLDELNALTRARNNPVFQLAGVKGGREFARGARNVLVREREGAIHLDPSKTMEKGWFEFLADEKTVTLPGSVTPAELAEGLREALTRCEPLHD
jgi:CDI immunity protein